MEYEDGTVVDVLEDSWELRGTTGSSAFGEMDGGVEEAGGIILEGEG